MSNSVRPHRWQPTRLPFPQDSPGKNTGVGCHFLLQCMKVKSESEVAQSCPTLSDPTDCSLTGSSVHGIFQSRVLEWGAIAFSDFIHKTSNSLDKTTFFKKIEFFLMCFKSILFTYLFIYLFWLNCCMRTLVSPPRIEPTLPAVETQSLNHWTTGKSQGQLIISNRQTHFIKCGTFVTALSRLVKFNYRDL